MATNTVQLVRCHTKIKVRPFQFLPAGTVEYTDQELEEMRKTYLDAGLYRLLQSKIDLLGLWMQYITIVNGQYVATVWDDPSDYQKWANKVES